MFLSKCEDLTELINFLKLDYANNLYFFTYLNNIDNNPDIEFLIAKIEDRIAAALLLTPVHCCISSLKIEYIYSLADQLPPIDSIHIVGRRDLVEQLLKVSKGPERDQHIYSFCEFSPASIPSTLTTASQKASALDLDSLINFYNNNDMLMDAASRLQSILSWGKAYFVKKDDEIVSCALTTTETNDAAMIGAVYTTPAFRNNGYARDCILSLCKELVSQHKRPHLFYKSDDVFLSGLYKSLGFRQIDTWVLASRK